MKHYKRIFTIVIDSLGAGALPDAADYGDAGTDTMGHISQAVEKFHIPNLQKLGLANLVTIVALVKIGLKPTIVISLGRIVLSGVLFGNVTVILYSLAGAFLSILVMSLVRKIKIFTLTGVSICGAVSHNFGQIIVAALILENSNIMYYMLVLGIAGAIAGTVIGILSGIILKNIRF